jgi:hypothetical protein
MQKLAGMATSIVKKGAEQPDGASAQPDPAAAPPVAQTGAAATPPAQPAAPAPAAAPAQPSPAADSPKPADVSPPDTPAGATGPADPNAVPSDLEGEDLSPIETRTSIRAAASAPGQDQAAPAGQPVVDLAPLRKVLGKEVASIEDAAAAVTALQGRVGQLTSQLERLQKSPVASRAKSPVAQVAIDMLEGVREWDDAAIARVADEIKSITRDPMAKDASGRYLVSDAQILREDFAARLPDLPMQEIQAEIEALSPVQLADRADQVRNNQRRAREARIAEFKRKQDQAARQRAAADSLRAPDEFILEQSRAVIQTADEIRKNLVGQTINGHRLTQAVVDDLAEIVKETGEAFARGEDLIAEYVFTKEDGSFNTEVIPLIVALFDRRVHPDVRNALRQPFVPIKKIRDEVRREIEQRLTAGTGSSPMRGLPAAQVAAPPPQPEPAAPNTPKTFTLPTGPVKVIR